MSEPIRLKLHDTEQFVEIDLRDMKHYENRVELGLMLKTHTMATNEDDSAILAEEVVHQLVGVMQESLASKNHPYGVEITNWQVAVHETNIAEEEE